MAFHPWAQKPTPESRGGNTRVGFSWEAMCALLPLSGRERAGVRVPAHGASSSSPRPSPPAGARETKAAAPVLSRKKTYPRKPPPCGARPPGHLPRRVGSLHADHARTRGPGRSWLAPPGRLRAPRGPGHGPGSGRDGRDHLRAPTAATGLRPGGLFRPAPPRRPDALLSSVPMPQSRYKDTAEGADGE